MKTNHWIIAGLCAGFFTGTGAFAGDDWKGLYLGAQLGSAHSESIFGDLGDDYDNQEPAGLTDDAASKGLYLGYSLQKGSFVYGLEANWLILGNENLSQAGCFNCTVPPEIRTAIDSVKSLKVRAGVAVDNALVYMAAGPAWAKIDYTNDANDFGTNLIKQGVTYQGLALATGVEAKLFPHVVARLQGEMINFRDNVYYDAPNNEKFRDTTSLLNVSIGVAYLF